MSKKPKMMMSKEEMKQMKGGSKDDKKSGKGKKLPPWMKGKGK